MYTVHVYYVPVGKSLNITTTSATVHPVNAVPFLWDPTALTSSSSYRHKW